MLNIIYLLYLIVETKCYCSNCIKCDEDVCLQCDNGYGPETDPKSENYGKCFRCFEYYGICNMCSTDIHKCTECDENYTVDTDENSPTNGRCIACPKNCKNCNGVKFGECSLCIDGYGPDANKKCAKCIDPVCLECGRDNNNCTKCPFGYSINKEGKCEKCHDPHCIYCDQNASFCDGCEDGYFVRIDENREFTGYCEDINNYVENCRRGLLQSDGFLCQACSYGYRKNNNKCEKCQVENCRNCDTSASKCDVCYPGFNCAVSSGTECFNCAELDENCVSCNQNYCHQCKDGYVVTNTKTCTVSPFENCNEIFDGACEYCMTGYGFDENKEKCIKCEIEGCYSCGKNYKLCDKCKDHKICELCDENGKCTMCPDGYVLKDEKCVKCGVENCRSCLISDPNKCLMCFPGYQTVTLDVLNNERECVQCTDINCGGCQSDKDSCDACLRGFGFDYRKGTCQYQKCIKCEVENCISCNGNPTYCVECDPDYPDCFDRTIKDDDVDFYIGDCPDNDDKNDENKSDNDTNSSDSNEQFETISDNGNDDDNNNDTTEKNGNNDKKKLSTGAIVGISIGCVAVVGLTVGLLIYFLIFRKARVGVSSS